MAKKLTSDQAKNLAYSIFMTEDNISDMELGERVGGFSRVTIGKWRREGLWDDLKDASATTNDSILKDTMLQYNEIQEHINKRPIGERFPTYNEISIIRELRKSLKELKGDASVADLLQHNKIIVKHLRSNYPEKLKEWILILDELVKERV